MNPKRSSPVWFTVAEMSKCGYCQSADDRNPFCYIIRCSKLSSNVYQLLLDRGFRRCGTFYYRRFMRRSCCALYSNRCDAIKLELSSSQRRLVGRVIKTCSSEGSPAVRHSDVSPIEIGRQHVRRWKARLLAQTSSRGSSDCPLDRTCSAFATALRAFGDYMAGVDCAPEPSGLGAQRRTKRKHIRMVRKIAKQRKQGNMLAFEDIERYIASKQFKPCASFDDTAEQLFRSMEAHGFSFEVIAVGQVTEENRSVLREEFEIYKIYQHTVHKDNNSQTFGGFCRFLVNSNLSPRSNLPEMSMENSWTSAESFDQACTRPLSNLFHELYRLNGRLIGVSVFDLLPSGLSSVYYFYNPQFGSYCLGTISAIRDIYRIRKSYFEGAKSFRFYHLGLFSYDQPKLKYKVKYRPSELLCPFCFRWVEYDGTAFERYSYQSICIALTNVKGGCSDESIVHPLECLSILPLNDQCQVSTDHIHFRFEYYKETLCRLLKEPQLLLTDADDDTRPALERYIRNYVKTVGFKAACWLVPMLTKRPIA